MHREMMAKGGHIVADTLFGPEHVRVRAIDWDQSDCGIHQGAQQSCNSDAVYMAATSQTPKAIDQHLPSGHHPYMVRGQCRTDAGFCIEALKEALATYGPPEIFNSDQGSQFTSTDFTDVLKDAKVKVSMDGRGRWIDNRMIERLWRSLKYECVFLNAFETGLEARRGIGAWIAYYNEERPHSSHGLMTPDEVYANRKPNLKLAA